MYKKILIPTDGSENSKRANKHALWIADKSDADIVIMYVIEPHYPELLATELPISTLPSPDERFYEEIRDEGKQIIENFRKELEDVQCKGICKNTNLKTIMTEGKPSNEIVNVLDKENIDLVVMGASGRHGLDRFVIGSVTERVVRNARKPVMVIP
jgi:nucleotide-binding universal stress UspA family protein